MDLLKGDEHNDDANRISNVFHQTMTCLMEDVALLQQMSCIAITSRQDARQQLHDLNETTSLVEQRVQEFTKMVQEERSSLKMLEALHHETQQQHEALQRLLEDAGSIEENQPHTSWSMQQHSNDDDDDSRYLDSRTASAVQYSYDASLTLLADRSRVSQVGSDSGILNNHHHVDTIMREPYRRTSHFRYSVDGTSRDAILQNDSNSFVSQSLLLQAPREQRKTSGSRYEQQQPSSEHEQQHEQKGGLDDKENDIVECLRRINLSSPTVAAVKPVRTPKAVPTIPFVPLSETEFLSIPRTIRGRILSRTVNDALRDIISVCHMKHAAIATSSTPSPGYDNTKFEEHHAATTNYSSISEHDLRKSSAFFRWGEATARCILAILCSSKRLQQVPSPKGQITYNIITAANEQEDAAASNEKGAPSLITATMPASTGYRHES